ncbi:hypothetical protein [Streptomyces sp. CRN 30]|uniref:hypothetical protein n=1 Tax=Streptomyces sp. CRN 30 TaxID=3075613 RepID=UPI002A8281EA|nr:hypothetical protein [Streptomyces sp. CRN 30]
MTTAPHTLRTDRPDDPLGPDERASAWYDTPRGRAAVDRHRDTAGFRSTVTLPPGAPTRMELPLPDGGRDVRHVPPGTHEFTVPGGRPDPREPAPRGES